MDDIAHGDLSLVAGAVELAFNAVKQKQAWVPARRGPGPIKWPN
jgi:hypothetical protein